MSNNTNLQKINFAFPVSSLESYIARINQIPMLTYEEEQELATQFQRHKDIQAAKQLLLSHLRFVVRVARGYLGYGLALADLIQEGSIGLMKAIKRFDPTVGVRLVSFAVHWVKAEIHEFILRNWRIVKIATTKAQRKLFFNLRKSTQNLVSFNEENIQAVAEDLQVGSDDVRMMHMRLNNHDEAFDSVEKNDDRLTALSPEQYLEDHRYDPARLLESKDWAETREHHLQQALSSLDERSQDILRRRWLAQKKATLFELADEYNLSAERIRQIEKIAMTKLKSVLSENIQEEK